MKILAAAARAFPRIWFKSRKTSLSTVNHHGFICSCFLTVAVRWPAHREKHWASSHFYQRRRKQMAKDKNFIPVVRTDRRQWEAMCPWGTVAALTLYVPCKGQHFPFFCFTPCMHKSKLLAIFIFEVGNASHQKENIICTIRVFATWIKYHLLLGANVLIKYEMLNTFFMGWFEKWMLAVKIIWFSIIHQCFPISVMLNRNIAH